MDSYHGTTIVSVRRGGVVALGGDGQVTLGNIVVKATARKVRKLYHDQVLAGFAGATADAFRLFERFEAKLEKHQGHLTRAAIDYCVTYEVSPPSWEAARCIVRITGSNQGTTQPPLSVVSDVSTSFQESQLTDSPQMVEVGTVELSGQLIGDIGLTLKKMDSELGTSKIVNVSCARLIRVDFIAAGDLLNWVLARRSEKRTVSFIDAHRMVALFFGAMGINEHANVKVRTV